MKCKKNINDNRLKANILTLGGLTLFSNINTVMWKEKTGDDVNVESVE